MYKHSKRKNILQSPCRCVSETRMSSLGLQEAAMNQGTFTASSSDPCVELDFVSVPLASFSFTSNMHTDTPLEMSVF